MCYGKTDTGNRSRAWVTLPSSWNDVWELGSLPEWRNQVRSWVLLATADGFSAEEREGWEGEQTSLQGVALGKQLCTQEGYGFCLL